MVTGTVKNFSAYMRCGFIIPDDGGKYVYVCTSEIQTADGTLKEGQKVSMEVTQGEKGAQAENVIAEQVAAGWSYKNTTGLTRASI